MLERASIRREWEKVRLGLNSIIQERDVKWRVEDIYASVLYEKSYLYMGDEGFIIVKPQADFYTGELELFIWIAYGTGQFLQEKYLHELSEMAKGFGATSLLMESDRRGYEKRGGWEIENVIYRRKLS